MKTINYLIIKTAVMLIVVLIFGSCHEKGCTNRNALNYNVTADQDDGSCIICNKSINNLSSLSVYLVDDNSSSQFFNQAVARFDLTEPLTSYNYSQCGVGNCTLNLSVTNLINKSIFVEYELRNEFGPVEVFVENDLNLSANSSSNLGVIETFTNPPFQPVNEDSVVVETFGNITYN